MNDATEIRNRIKQIIGNISGINPDSIQDGDSLRDDLKLDSLSMLEIGVDVDLAFKLNLPDEKYREVGSLPQMVELVQTRLSEAGNLVPQAEAVGG